MIQTTAAGFRDQLVPLYSEGWAAHVTLRRVDGDWILDAEIDDPMERTIAGIWNELWFRWPVSPRIRGSALADLLEHEAVQGLCVRIVEGWSEDLNDYNETVGILTDDAHLADMQLEQLFSGYDGWGFREGDLVPV